MPWACLEKIFLGNLKFYLKIYCKNQLFSSAFDDKMSSFALVVYVEIVLYTFHAFVDKITFE